MKNFEKNAIERKRQIEKCQDITDACDKASALSLGLAAISASFVFSHTVFSSEDFLAMAGLAGTAIGVVGSCIANTIGDIVHDKGQDMAFKEIEKTCDNISNNMEMGE